MIELLDLKDKKILFELEQESRQSLQQIAKKVRLRKETIFHRIKNLEKKGIIKGYLTEINNYKIGYQFYPMLLQFQDTTPEIEDEIYRYLRNDSSVSWLTRCEGAWDINLTIAAKSNSGLNQFLERFLSKYSSYIAEKQVFITTEIHYFKRGYWLNQPTLQTISASTEPISTIDEVEERLLQLLSRNAREPLVKIGQTLGTSQKSVAYKIKKLEREQIIQGSRIRVDFAKLGYKFYKVWFALKNMKEGDVKKLISFFRMQKNIIWATKLIGMYDLSIEMEVRDVEEYRKVMGAIKEKFSDHIKKQESMLILEEATVNYFP